MQVEQQEMQRLGAGGVHPSSLEARAGAFLREARPLTGISNAQVEAIEAALVRPGPMRRGVRLVPVFVAVAVLLIAGSGMALVGGWLPRTSLFGDVPMPPILPPPPPAMVRATTPARAEPPQPATAPVAEMPASEPRPQPARRTTRVEPPAAARTPVTDTPAVEGTRSAETHSLADALARWRRDGQGETALALLVAHERRFPRGGLAVESRIARAEILLSLNRREQALAVFDSLTLTGLPRARELETLRGELRAQAGRCEDAREDLARVLAGADSDDLGKRATRAMVSCQ